MTAACYHRKSKIADVQSTMDNVINSLLVFRTVHSSYSMDDN